MIRRGGMLRIGHSTFIYIPSRGWHVKNRKEEKPTIEPINAPININMNLELYCRFLLFIFYLSFLKFHIF